MLSFTLGNVASGPFFPAAYQGAATGRQAKWGFSPSNRVIGNHCVVSTFARHDPLEYCYTGHYFCSRAGDYIP